MVVVDEYLPAASKQDEAPCQYCLDYVLLPDLQVHQTKEHSSKMIACYQCPVEQRFLANKIADLRHHFNQEHGEEIFDFAKIEIKRADDLIMNVCKICTMELYTGDPVILATHLLDHDLGPDLARFKQFCRLCIGDGKELIEIADLKEHCVQHHGTAGADLVDYSVCKSYEQVHQKSANAEAESHPSSKVVLKVFAPNKGDINASAGNRQFTKSDLCDFCNESVAEGKLNFHILTQHSKNSFRCSLCFRSKIKKPETVVCFATLHEAGDHMKQFHGVDFLKKLTSISSGAEEGAECMVYSILKAVCPFLSLPTNYQMMACTACDRRFLSTQLTHVCDEAGSNGGASSLVLKCRLCYRDLNVSSANSHINNYEK